MRNGRLLAEGNPQEVMHQLNASVSKVSLRQPDLTEMREMTTNTSTKFRAPFT